MKPTSTPWVLSGAIGLTVALAISFATGRAEAWDHESYWAVGYPIFVVAALLLGWTFPERPWRWAVTMMVVQAVPLLFSGSDHSLAPLGAVLLALMALPLCVAAKLTAALRTRSRSAVK